MAHVLTEGERNVVAESLSAFADQLAGADETNNPAVDRLVSERRRSAERLRDLAVASTRISFTVQDGD